MKNIKLWHVLMLVALLGVVACDSDEDNPVDPGPGTKALVINEFMASNDTWDVDGAGEFPDWIELFNPGTADVDIGGWYMTDKLADDVADWYQIPAGNPATVVPAGGWLVLYANGTPGDGVLYLDFKLGSGGDDIGLADGNENIVDSLTYEQQTTDVSMGLTPDGTGTMAFLATATAGAANSGASGNLPPVISDVDLDPVSPLPDTDVTVTAEVFDDSGILSVTLFYNVDGGAWTEMAMTPLKVTGNYSAVIPGQAVNAVVGYYVRAMDTNEEMVFEPEGAPTNFDTYTPVFQLTFTLYINEFMADNSVTLVAPGEYVDPADAYVDWIEIYNPGTEDIDLGGMYITDDLTSTMEWQIPTTQPDSTTVPAGGYLVLFADKDSDRGVLHVEIKLGSGGEDVGLFADDGNSNILLVDGYTFGAQTVDVSEGRETDGDENWTTFITATPGASNSGK